MADQNTVIQENIVETALREGRKPFKIADTELVALPDGFKLEDMEKFDSVPRRKKAVVTIADDKSFVDYIKRHGSLASCTIWCDANYQNGSVNYTAIINDHQEAADGQQWRDHLARFKPALSVEWLRWTSKNKVNMSQLDFATFLEENLGDIASAEGYPTGTAMLQMATALEISQDSRIKSAIRLQSGGVRMEYVQDENAESAQSMEVFSRFALGLPVFWGGAAYQIEARLKYRLSGGKLTFWYELNRADKALEDAAKELTKSIKDASGFPLFHGNPF